MLQDNSSNLKIAESHLESALPALDNLLAGLMRSLPPVRSGTETRA